MFRAALGVVGLLSALAAVPPASAEGNSDYSVPVSYTHLRAHET